MGNIDRYDQSELQERHQSIQELSSPITDDDSDPNSLLLQEDVGRQNFLRIILKNSIPLPEWCFPPYDASGNWIQYAKIFRSLFFHGLKGSPSHGASVTAVPGITETTYSQGFHNFIRVWMPGLSPPGESIDSPGYIQSLHTKVRDDLNRKWAEEQLDSYERYLQLPVNDKVLRQALEEYDERLRWGGRLSKGLVLHGLAVQCGNRWTYVDEREPDADSPGTIEVLTITRAKLRNDWDGPASLKKEAPSTHPIITNLNLDFKRLIVPEYGIVVAWKYDESDSWMDRYGHLV